MKILSLISLLLLVSSNMVAQDDFVNKMNDIKLSGKYFTAQSRGETEEEAFETCVRDILLQLTPGKYDESYVRSRVKRLSKPGTPCRVFVYLEKDYASHSAPQPPAKNTAKVERSIAQPDMSILSQLITDLKARPTIANAFHSFRAKKDLGLVGNYGLMKDVANSDAAYIVIYDADTDELMAILTPSTTGGRRNLITNSPDSYDNYHGKRAFWFTLK